MMLKQEIFGSNLEFNFFYYYFILMKDKLFRGSDFLFLERNNSVNSSFCVKGEDKFLDFF